jgi:hypothetical protein
MDEQMSETFSQERSDEIGRAFEVAPRIQRPLTKSELLAKHAVAMKRLKDEENYTLEKIVEFLAGLKVRTHARAVSEAIGRLDAVKPARGRKGKRKVSETPVGGEDAQVRQKLEAAGQQRLAN